MAERDNHDRHNEPETPPQPEGLTRLCVEGFKSIRDRTCIDIAPLTILAGANSSGKSSIMQPLLLLKQTLEAPYDPGALLLNGPNVAFTSSQQLLSKTQGKSSQSRFTIAYGRGINSVSLTFAPSVREGFTIEETQYVRRSVRLRLINTEPYLMVDSYSEDISSRYERLIRAVLAGKSEPVIRNRCFLDLNVDALSKATLDINGQDPFTDTIEGSIRDIVHVPGVRSYSSRAYPIASHTGMYPGAFDNYVATVIDQWQHDTRSALNDLVSDFQILGLTSSVVVSKLNDAQIELSVGRLAGKIDSRKRDLVNIADVGFGVSQVLPVLVGLRVARPGQLVYIEQPELHLHPRAQVALGRIIAEAAIRGVQVVMETHSSLLLLSIQTLVAEGELAPELVKLHWFTRGRDGFTKVTTAELDDAGSFGPWPEDFDDVLLEAQSRYLNAAQSRRRMHA